MTQTSTSLSLPLSTDQRAASHDLFSKAQKHDGAAPLSEHFLKLLDREEALDTVVVVAVQDADENVLVGLAVADGDTAEMVVDPDYRRQGIGQHLVEQLREHAVVKVWSHGNGEGAKAFARARNFPQTRGLKVMRLAGDALADYLNQSGIPTSEEVTSSSGVWPLGEKTVMTTYAAAVSQCGQNFVDDAFVAVNNAAFDWHPEQGGWDRARFAEARDTDWFDPAGFFLVWSVDDAGSLDELQGFHWTKRHPEGDGEVYVIGIAPAAQGTGLFRPLMGYGIAHLVATCGSDAGIILYVEDDNTVAVNGYERLGFTTVEEHVVYAIGDETHSSSAEK